MSNPGISLNFYGINYAYSAPTTSEPADGVSFADITVTITNASSGLPVANKSVTGAISPSTASATFSPAQGTTDSNGRVVFTVKDTVVENVTFTAT
jgi:hypothetical protein